METLDTKNTILKFTIPLDEINSRLRHAEKNTIEYIRKPHS